MGFFFGFVFHVRDLLTLRRTTTLTLPRYVYIFSTNESNTHLMCLTHFSPCMADAQTASPPGKGATVITGCPFIVTHCNSLHMARTSLHITTNLQLNQLQLCSVPFYNSFLSPVHHPYLSHGWPWEKVSTVQVSRHLTSLLVDNMRLSPGSTLLSACCFLGKVQ